MWHPYKGFRRGWSGWHLHVTFGRGALGLTFACVVIFAMQRVAARTELAAGQSFEELLVYCFGLHWPLLARGFFWQPFTYMFLHGSWLHLAMNMVTVLLFGSGLEEEIGTRKFLRVFVLSGVVGGLGWLALDWGDPLLAAWLRQLGHPWALWWARHLAPAYAALRFGKCIGASAGVFGLVGAYAALFPHRKVVLLLGWPVTLQARTLAVLLVLVTVVELVVGRGQVAYAAHLAGGLAGYACGRRWLRADGPPDTDEHAARLRRAGMPHVPPGCGCR